MLSLCQASTEKIFKNSHGLTWSINIQAQPTTKHESNSMSYWDFHIKKRIPGCRAGFFCTPVKLLSHNKGIFVGLIEALQYG